MLGSVFSVTTGFLRRVGNQAAVSVAASAIAAALLALPGGFWGTMPGQAGEHSDQIADKLAVQDWASPVAPDGKLRDRHHDAVGGNAIAQLLSGQALLMPAAVAMPMAVSWSQPVAEPALVIHAQTPAAVEPRSRQLQAQALPPRRTPLERTMPGVESAPLAITPPIQLAAMTPDPALVDAGTRPPATVLGRAVPGPVARVGDAVSNAVGMVGAAGNWTLSQASGLLPRL